jgi:hypothetical protein
VEPIPRGVQPPCRRRESASRSRTRPVSFSQRTVHLRTGSGWPGTQSLCRGVALLRQGDPDRVVREARHAAHRDQQDRRRFVGADPSAPVVVEQTASRPPGPGPRVRDEAGEDPDSLRRVRYVSSPRPGRRGGLAAPRRTRVGMELAVAAIGEWVTRPRLRDRPGSGSPLFQCPQPDSMPGIRVSPARTPGRTLSRTVVHCRHSQQDGPLRPYW